MNQPPFSALQAALWANPGPHPDDETLAEIATLEAAGEIIETLYPGEIAHLETCLACAESYHALITHLQAALGQMAAQAAQVPAAQVYAAILGQAIAGQPQAAPLNPVQLTGISARLPGVFAALPASPAEVPGETLAAALPDPATRSPQTIAALQKAIGNSLAALALYLQGAADHLWGQVVQAQAQQNRIRLHLQAAPAIPTLSETAPQNEEWFLFSQRVGAPIPYEVRCQAKRVTAIACQLCLQIDHPGLSDASGKTVTIHIPGQSQTARTNHQGVACFELVPIAALPEIEIEL